MRTTGPSFSCAVSLAAFSRPSHLIRKLQMREKGTVKWALGIDDRGDRKAICKIRSSQRPRAAAITVEAVMNIATSAALLHR